MQKFEEIKNIIAEMEHDVEKVNRGNHAAGTRVRKALQTLKRAAQEMRIEIQSMKKAEN
jgi:hypothetical protein